MSTEAAPVTICPNCEARIPKQGMSLCPYCAFPLGKASDASGEDRSPIVKRLQAMEEKPEFEAALAEVSPWTPEYTQAANRQMHARVLLALGVVVIALASVLGGGDLLSPWTVLGGALFVVGLVWLLRATALRKRLASTKVLARSAYIVRRRSESDMKGPVTYFYELQFGDGSEGEFAYPGRGASEDPYTNGMTGVAFTRGTELLHMERVRG
jgi:hypothetical protein